MPFTVGYKKSVCRKSFMAENGHAISMRMGLVLFLALSIGGCGSGDGTGGTDTPTATPSSADTPTATPSNASRKPMDKNPDFYWGSKPTCIFMPASNASVDKLQVLIKIANTHQDVVRYQIPFDLVGETGQQGGGVANSEAGINVLEIPLAPSDFDQKHRITLTIDPENIIQETNESNNSMILEGDIPMRPNQIQKLPCSSIE